MLVPESQDVIEFHNKNRGEKPIVRSTKGITTQNKEVKATQLKNLTLSSASSEKAQGEVGIASEWNEVDWLRFHDEFAVHIRRWARRYTGFGPHIDDILQNVLIFAYQRAAEMPYPTYTKTWLYRVTRFISLRHHEKKGIQQRLVNNVTGIIQVQEQCVHEGDHAFENQDLIHQALSTLCPEYREAIILCDLEGMTSKEASELSGTNAATLRTYLAKGRKAFRSNFIRLQEHNTTQTNSKELSI